MSYRQRVRQSIDEAYEHHGEDAAYRIWNSERGEHAAAVDIKVLPTTQDQLVDFDLATVRQDQTLFGIRASDVREPRKDDVLAFDGIAFLVDTARRKGRYGLEWIVAVSKK